MEDIADLIPFAIIAAFWLLRALRGGQKQRRPTDSMQSADAAPTAESSAPSDPTPFEMLMRQLEDALEEPREKEPREPEIEAPRPVERQAERPPAPRAIPKPPLAVPRTFQAPTPLEESFKAAFEHERHGFGAENPLSEEIFEQQPAFATHRRPVAPDVDPHALRAGRSASDPTGGRSGRNQARQRPRRGASAWAERLHDPAAAREALVLKTIFEGPWKPRSARKGN